MFIYFLKIISQVMAMEATTQGLQYLQR